MTVKKGCMVFEPEDAQQLVNDVLNDSFEQLLNSTGVEGQVIRLRDQTW